MSIPTGANVKAEAPCASHRSMQSSRRRFTLALTAGLAVMLTAACGGSTTDDAPTSEDTTATSTTVSSSPTTPSTTVATEAPRAPATQSTIPVVAEGAECGPRGASAVFADGAPAYCARLQYTDGAAWSRDPDLARNPAVSQMLEQSGPAIGDRCIGADIGRTAVDDLGNAIVCDNYRWIEDMGQRPSHPWVDDQVEWAECMENHTTEQCREMLN